MGVSCFKSEAGHVSRQGLCYNSVDLFRFDLLLSLLFIKKKKAAENRWWVKGMWDRLSRKSIFRGMGGCSAWPFYQKGGGKKTTCPGLRPSTPR